MAEIGGKQTNLGAQDAVGLPQETWSMTNFTLEDYQDLLAKVKSGKVKIDDQLVRNENLFKCKFRLYSIGFN